MSKTYIATVPVESNGKTYFNRVGVAFLQREGSKSFMKIMLSAVPLSGELVLFEPKDHDDTDSPIEE